MKTPSLKGVLEQRRRERESAPSTSGPSASSTAQAEATHADRQAHARALHEAIETAADELASAEVEVEMRDFLVYVRRGNARLRCFGQAGQYEIAEIAEMGTEWWGPGDLEAALRRVAVFVEGGSSART